MNIHLWTDGASSPDGRGGWAFILQAVCDDGTVLRETEVSGGVCDTTNNRMEMVAIIEGLQALKFPTAVIVHSDSKYAMGGFREGWVAKWAAAGWVRKAAHGREPVKNEDLWRELDRLVARHDVEWIHVHGHAGDVMNERCDVLAVAAKHALLIQVVPELDDELDRALGVL